MSNSLTTRPIIITSVMGSSFKAATGRTQGINPKQIYWASPVAVNDQVIITDPVSGHVLWQAKCAVAAQGFQMDLSGGVWKDFIVSTIGSGTLFIYCVD